MLCILIEWNKIFHLKNYKCSKQSTPITTLCYFIHSNTDESRLFYLQQVSLHGSFEWRNSWDRLQVIVSTFENLLMCSLFRRYQKYLTQRFRYVDAFVDINGSFRCLEDNILFVGISLKYVYTVSRRWFQYLLLIYICTMYI